MVPRTSVAADHENGTSGNMPRSEGIVVARKKDYSLQEIARHTGGQVSGGGDLVIHGIAPITSASEDEISFIDAADKLNLVRESRAGAVIVPAAVLAQVDRPAIGVDNPRLAFVEVLGLFSPPVEVPVGVDPGAHIGEGVSLGNGVRIGPGVTVGDRVLIADDVIVCPGVHISSDVTIGPRTHIHPGVVIREAVSIGADVIIQPGAVIGSDGFGYVSVDGRHVKMPHVGGVRIEDEVEIGANVTIDRGTCGTTVIGRGTKVDNLVQIGHNVIIGENCLIVAMVGLAGSTRIGSGVRLAGQVGVTGHLTIGDNSTVLARTMVTKDLPAGSVVSGAPAQTHRDELRLAAAQRRLPEIIERVRSLEKRLEQITGRNSG